MKPNRAHYVCDTYLHSNDGWRETARKVCVYHGRRIYGPYRVRVVRAIKGMSRPIEEACTDCATDVNRCECNAQGHKCLGHSGGTCGRDFGDELGGSW